LWLSGNLLLNTPDSYLTTKNTKITREEKNKFKIHLRALRG
jgi:hypothetical protein